MYNPVKISEFLHRKKELIKIDPNKDYSLVTVKLHHKGVVLREEKKGSLLGSNMYRVSKGQFILSGIDARNGAFGIVPDELDGAIVTNDFWYFDFDESKVKQDFFYWLTNTPLFLDACQKSSKGETQRIRLQKNLFYNFEFHFPPVDKQEEFLNRIYNVDSSLSLLKTEQEIQSSYISLFRQAILREAIEGKHTVAWRMKNPELISDENHASKLLEKIKAEKKQLIKKDKPLAPITDAEKPFDLPDGWVWCRLGDICDFIYGDSLTKSQCKEDGKYPVYGSNGIVGYYDRYLTDKKAIIVGRKGSAGALNLCRVPSWTTDVAYYIEDRKIINFEFMFYLLKSLQLEKLGKGIKPGVNRNEAYNLLIVLAPIAEQKVIVERVDNLMAMIDELEKQVTERKDKSERLMQAVLRDAFENKA